METKHVTSLIKVCLLALQGHHLERRAGNPIALVGEEASLLLEGEQGLEVRGHQCASLSHRFWGSGSRKVFFDF